MPVGLYMIAMLRRITLKKAAAHRHLQTLPEIAKIADKLSVSAYPLRCCSG